MDNAAFIATELAQLLAQPKTAALLVLLVAAALIDSRTVRIPNWLTSAGLLTGLGFAVLGSPSALDGAAGALGGIGVALLVFVPLWVVRALGAGDVKLMLAVGAFLGPLGVAQAAILVFVTGGVFAFVHAASHGVLGRLATNLRVTAWSVLPSTMGLRAGLRAAGAASVGKLPYGWSICVGTCAFLLARHFAFL
jgi:prepilin peptidase CpaA